MDKRHVLSFKRRFKNDTNLHTHQFDFKRLSKYYNHEYRNQMKQITNTPIDSIYNSTPKSCLKGMLRGSGFVNKIEQEPIQRKYIFSRSDKSRPSGLATPNKG